MKVDQNLFHGNEQLRTYKRNECIAFRKTNEEFGGLSNMAPGFPITIEQERFLTSEALYQACRYPDYPEIQKDIIAQHSPMTAKMISKRHKHLTRPYWDEDRIKIMRWCLHAKLISNWHSFGGLLETTGDMPIVEDSPKDDFWGAILQNELYVGVNALGRLLMQSRELYRRRKDTNLLSLPPPKIDNFMLVGISVPKLYIDVSKQPYTTDIKMW